MIVVLDTTETFHDLRLDGPNFKLLQAYLHDTSSKLAIPRIVYEETVNHFREKLTKAVQACECNLRDLKELMVTPGFDVPQVAVDESTELQEFRAHLAAQITRLNGEVIGFDAVEVTALIERSLQRRKPFDSGGRKGFRDAVLWETVLREVIEKGPADVKVALVTKDSTGFGKDERLADDLQHDCKAIGKHEGCVRLFNGLKAFIDAEVKPHLETLEIIQEQIQEGGYKEFDPSEFFCDFNDSISRRVRETVKRCDFDGLTRWTVCNFRSPDLRSLATTCSAYGVVDVWSIDEDQVAVGIDFDVEGEIECLEEQVDYHPMGDDIFPEWYEEEFVGDATFEVSMTVILDKESGRLEDYEVNDVKISLGIRWPYPDDD